MRTISEDPTKPGRVKCARRGQRKRVKHCADFARPQYGWGASRRKTEGGKGKGKRGKAQFYHTDTTGSYVGSHHDWALARLEFVQDPISFLLLLVTVNG